MKKAAIYARVSTTGGRQDYQRQVNDLTRVIISHGRTENDILIFADEISGYSKNEERPALQRMLAAIENGEIDIIYVTEISRLGRNPNITRQTVDQFSEMGIPVYIQTIGMATLEPNGKRNTIVNIILQVLLEFANSEAEQTKERSKSGLLNSAKKGRAGGGVSHPYGYTKGENKMLVIDEEEAPIVKEIYQMYLEGNGAKVIASILQQRGAPTKYNRIFGDKIIKNSIQKKANSMKWTDVVVLNILSNTIYKGERMFKEQVIPCPAIIDADTWEKCNDIRQNKTHRNYLTTYDYLLKDIIKCGCCGRNYYGRYKPVKNGDKVYKCSSTLITGGSCKNKGVNISLLESAIYDQLLKSDIILKYFQEARGIRKELEKEISQIEIALEKEKAVVTENEAKNKRLLKIYLDGGHLTPHEFGQNKEEISKVIENSQKRIKMLNKQLTERKASLKRETAKGATKAMLIDAKDDRKKLEILFKQVIEKVIINDLSVNKIMASVYIKVNGLNLARPLVLILDKFSIRKTYKYLPISSMENEPVFKDGILMVDVEDILYEVENGFYPDAWCEIRDENVLNIMRTDSEVTLVA